MARIYDPTTKSYVEKEDYTYNPFTYGEYRESGAVISARNKANTANNAVTNYGNFAWKDQSRYDNLIKQYENRPDFSYDFNGDALYQQYKDKYIQQGKMAMADTMGQASAMTGGYGNSYAATVGNQAYQAQLQNLNDIIPELYQMAYNRYQDEGQDMLNTIGILGGERDFAYGTWSDGYNRLVNDRDYYNSNYNNERTYDRGVYDTDRTLAYNDHTTSEGYRYQNLRDEVEDGQWHANMDWQDERAKVSDAQWQAEFDEGRRQYDEQSAWNKKVYEDEQTAKKNDELVSVTPTKTDLTSSFIGNHYTANDWARRGKSTSNEKDSNGNYKAGSFKAYIDAEISKVQDNLSDEELMYLKQYYGL